MTQRHDKTVCPNCGEPVEKTWKICPACETLLIALQCPQCKAPVKEHWKRCPECEASLLCKACGERIPPGSTTCPKCDPQETGYTGRRPEILEALTQMTFLHVPGGTFMMGDTFGDGFENERPVHPVRLDGFYIGKYPVTQDQWTAAMGYNPSKFQGTLHPVEQVSLQDVQGFIQKLTQAHKGKFRFDLPTEAQWEYAARSGGKNELYAGGHEVDALAWYEDNSDGSTQPVGKKAPNGLGLYDMSGNVWEWCQDSYRADAYKKHETENPVMANRGPDRVIRGGSWNLDAWSVRCARRFSFREDFSAPGLGVRLVILT